MKFFLKHIWLLIVSTSFGFSWLFITMLIMGEKLTFIRTAEQLLVAALFLPVIAFLGGSHLMWLLSDDWLNHE
jgi:hypothetical protein